MNTKMIALGSLTGLALAGGIAGMVSAQTAADATALTEEQVIEIALTEVAGEIDEIELEERRGVAFYEVEIEGEDGIEYELRIAADTGEILKLKADDEVCDDDDDDDEGEDA